MLDIEHLKTGRCAFQHIGQFDFECSWQRTFTTLWLLVSGLYASSAQDSLSLPEVLVRDIRFEKNGLNAHYLDTFPLISPITLADRLLLSNDIALRNNAPGALATLSLRGAGPARTVVLWQGLPLQSPQNGVIDANLIPFWPDDRVEIRPGGQSASLSSGAMGGAVLLDPSWPSHPAHVSVGLSTGRFGKYTTDADIQLKQGSFNARIRGAWQSAQNDFTFQNTALVGKPQQQQQNNALEKTDIQQYNRWIPNAKNSIKTALWYLQSAREIPASMTETPGNNKQWDKALRAVISWEYRPSQQSGWLTRAALTREMIAFRYNGDVDTSGARAVLLNTEYLKQGEGGWQWRAGASAWLQQGRADGYLDTIHWQGFQRWQGFAAVSRSVGRTQLSLLLRQEVADGQRAPFVWSLGAETNFRRLGTIKSHLSRNYNLPTLNDRLWAVWGNPDLLPENGFSADIGWHKSHQGWQFSITHYQLLLNNWIIWQPSGAIFTPDNLRKVWSRGGEAGLQYYQHIAAGLACRATARYQFVKATNIAVNQGAEATLNKQLPYTPEHAGSIGMGIDHRRWNVMYVHQFNGQRYVSGDNSVQVNGYQLGHLLVQAEKKWRGGMKSAVFFRLENVWNTTYTVIRFYPMPGRLWHVGVRFNVE